MPRPQYRDPGKKAVYLEVPLQVKEDWLDICYALDMDQHDAFIEVVRFFKEARKVKPRPSRTRK